MLSADFFYGEMYPTISFRSSSIVELDSSKYLVTGTLEMHGHSREVSFEAHFGGMGVDPYGNTKAGFTIEGAIKRSDFGLIWNAPLESGGVLLSDLVQLNGELQFSRV